MTNNRILMQSCSFIYHRLWIYSIHTLKPSAQLNYSCWISPPPPEQTPQQSGAGQGQASNGSLFVVSSTWTVMKSWSHEQSWNNQSVLTTLIILHWRTVLILEKHNLQINNLVHIFRVFSQFHHIICLQDLLIQSFLPIYNIKTVITLRFIYLFIHFS